MCCTIHSFPYHNIISAFRCPELERTHALWWCLLYPRPPPHPTSLSFPLFILETQVKLERQMFLFARSCRMTCSFRRLLPFLPPYRVTASLAGHCGRLRKRRGNSKRRLRIRWRRIPGGAENHLLTQFQMTLLGSVKHGRPSFGWSGKTKLYVRAFISTCLNDDVSKGQILCTLQLQAKSMLWKYELWPINTVKHLHLDLFAIHSDSWVLIEMKMTSYVQLITGPLIVSSTSYLHIVL